MNQILVEKSYSLCIQTIRVRSWLKSVDCDLIDSSNKQTKNNLKTSL